MVVLLLALLILGICFIAMYKKSKAPEGFNLAGKIFILTSVVVFLIHMLGGFNK